MSSFGRWSNLQFSFKEALIVSVQVLQLIVSAFHDTLVPKATLSQSFSHVGETSEETTVDNLTFTFLESPIDTTTFPIILDTLE